MEVAMKFCAIAGIVDHLSDMFSIEESTSPTRTLAPGWTVAFLSKA
jgi:hypothetical protein